MKITKNQLRKIILENLNLSEGKGNVTGPIANKIIKIIKESDSNDYVKEAAIDTIQIIEGLHGKDLCEIMDMPQVQSFLKEVGYYIKQGAIIFKSFVFVYGSFTALPTMINRHIKTLNTVPGKLRSLRRLYGRPLNPEDVAENDSADDLFSDISKNMGIDKIGREEMIEFLAIGIGLKDEKGNTRNPLNALINDDIITQKFANDVYSRHYELRKILDQDNIKENMLKAIMQKIEDDKEATTLSLSQMVDLASKFKA